MVIDLTKYSKISGGELPGSFQRLDFLEKLQKPDGGDEAFTELKAQISELTKDKPEKK